MKNENFKDDEKKFDPKEGKNKERSNKNKNKNKNRSNTYSSKKKGNVNDTGYYYTDPNVLASVTNFSFTEFLGVNVDYGTIVDKKMVERVSNVVAIRMNPSVQPTGTEGNTGYEAINVVGLRNYTNLTAGNGKTSNYGPVDPMMAVLAIGSAVSMYSHIRRAFNSYQLVNQRNREYPKLLFKAMGINWDDFKANIANYRDQFNLLVCQFDKIPMFDSITYLQKCKHMYEYLYVDEDSPLAQTYLFVPYSVWTLDEAYDSSGSGLVTTPLYSTWNDQNGASMQTLLDIFSQQIQRLTTSSTLNLVYSDILRLMQNGRGKSFLLETIPLIPDSNFAPIINVEIRHWLNNMMILGVPSDKDALPSVVTRGGTNSNDVTSDGSTGCLLYHPIFEFYRTTSIGLNAQQCLDAVMKSNLVNFDSMAPSIDDKVAALRLATRARVYNVTDGNDQVAYSNDIDLGDFYAVSMIIWSDTDTLTGTFKSNFVVLGDSGREDQLGGFSIKIDALSKLKYAPRLQLLDATPSAERPLTSTHGDLTYYTMIPHELTKRIKDSEMFGLFDFRLS